MTDQTKRPLHISPAYLPYLDRHRLYELFHEVARELVIQQPEDHVMFMKQVLANAAKSRDAPRVVLLAPRRVNTVELALEMAKLSQQIVITKADLLREKGRLNAGPDQRLTGQWLIRTLSILIRTNNAYRLGWILADCIHTDAEAKAIVRAGILPTHALHIIPPFYPDFDQLLYCHVPHEFPEYRARFLALRRVLSRTLHEVHVGERDVHEVAAECVRVSRLRPGIAPMKPRVLLIGPRGSGRKTQARLLVAKLGVVHVDFEYLLCQTWVADHDLGETMRNCKDEVCLHPELMAQVVNRRLLEEDCVTRGYALTHYPYTELDFRLLDGLDTPPNRVAFLELDMNVCRERIAGRRYDVDSGSKVDVRHPGPGPRMRDGRRDPADLARHPKDADDVVEAELGYYCEQYGAMRKYCAGTAAFINADQPEAHVHEALLALVARAGQAAPPRAGPHDLAADTSAPALDVPEENRCCCVPLPSVVKECYRSVFYGKHVTSEVVARRSGVIS